MFRVFWYPHKCTANGEVALTRGVIGSSLFRTAVHTRFWTLTRRCHSDKLLIWSDLMIYWSFEDLTRLVIHGWWFSGRELFGNYSASFSSVDMAWQMLDQLGEQFLSRLCIDWYCSHTRTYLSPGHINCQLFCTYDLFTTGNSPWRR